MERYVMWLLFVEAGIAVFLLIFIVWWTMFAGKKPVHPPAEKKERSSTPNADDGKN